MIITCDMAMDLVSLYKDGLASEDSKSAVKQHLKICPDCRKFYAQYGSQKPFNKVNIYDAPSFDLSDKYSVLAKHMRKRHVLSTAAVIAVIAVSVAIGIFGTIKMLDASEN